MMNHFFARFIVPFISLALMGSACNRPTKTMAEDTQLVAEPAEGQVSVLLVDEKQVDRLLTDFAEYGMRLKARNNRTKPSYTFYYTTASVAGDMLLEELKSRSYIESAMLLN